MAAKLSQINPNCITFDGTNDWLENSGVADIGLGNAWTVLGCVRTNSSGAKNILFFQPVTASHVNQIDFQQGGSQDINFDHYTSAGSAVANGLNRLTETLYPVRGWIVMALSWDGTNSRISVAGQTWTATNPTPTLTMTQTDRIITIGTDQLRASKFAGQIQDVALWSTALTQAEMNALTADDGAMLRDLRINFGSYASAASLVHYFRCGLGKGTAQSGGTYVCDDATNGAGIDVTVGSASLGDADVGTNGAYIPASKPGGGRSLDFNGTDEYLLTSATGAVNLADSWSIQVVVKSDRDTTDETILDMGPASGNVNRFRIQKMGAQTGDYLRLTVWSNTGTLLRDYQWNNALPTGTWVNLLFTRNGAGTNDPVVLYVNGSAVAETTLATNVNGTMGSSNRHVSIGANTSAAEFFDGRIAYVALWNVVLDSAAAAVIGGWDVNLARANGYDYAVAAELSNLTHWWRLGVPVPTAFGAGAAYVADVKTANAGSYINVSAAASGIDTSNIVTNDPPS